MKLEEKYEGSNVTEEFRSSTPFLQIFGEVENIQDSSRDLDTDICTDYE